MQSSDLVIHEEDFQRFTQVLERLLRDANAKLTFLLDKNGQQIARAGDMEQVDATSLASLTAGNVAATDGLAKLVGEKEFSILFHEGERDHLHISVVDKTILVVRFDERSSLGLVRLRVKRAHVDLLQILEQVNRRAADRHSASMSASSPFAEITDEDIDALFS